MPRLLDAVKSRLARRLRGWERHVEPPICHDLQAWAAGESQASFAVVDPAFVTTRPMPKTVEPAVHDSFAPLCSFSVPERAVVRIPGARIRGRHGLVVLPDGSFAGELLALTPGGREATLRGDRDFFTPLPARAVSKRGNYYSLLSPGLGHYYHWSHDVIMRMRGIAAALPGDTQLIVPERMKPFQRETLALLGLDAHLEIPFSGDEVWELEHLHVVTPILKTQIDSPEPYRWFREAAMARYRIAEHAPTRRLYLTRKDDGHWRTTNEAEVEALLSTHGFETVAPGKLSFREQIELFAQASLIVGTGAGLTNMIFSPSGAKVLQLQEREHVIHALWTMAAALGLEYHYFFCDSVPNPSGPNADIRVPLDKLEAALARLE